MSTAAIILAGGRASRLGGADKASVEVDGRALLDHVLDAVEGCSPLIVVGPSEEAVEASDAELDAALDDALEQLSPSRAAAKVAEQLNIPRKRAYARALERSK